jgi:WD40 repeat protein
MSSRVWRCIAGVLLVLLTAPVGSAEEDDRPRLLVGDAGHPSRVSTDAMVVSSDGRWLVTNDPFGPARVWDRKTGMAIRRLGGGCPATSDVALSQDTRLVAVLDRAKGVKVWDWRTRELRAHIERLEDVWQWDMRRLDLLENPLRLVWTEYPGRGRPRRDRSGNVVRNARRPIQHCVVRVVTLTERGEVKEERRIRMGAGTWCAHAFAPASGGLRLLRVDAQGRAAIIDPDDLRSVVRLESPVPELAAVELQTGVSVVDSAGSYLATAADGVLDVWKIETGADHIAMRKSNTTEVWDLRGREPRMISTMPRDRLQWGLGLTPGGDTLLCTRAHEDRTVLVERSLHAPDARERTYGACAPISLYPVPINGRETGGLFPAPDRLILLTSDEDAWEGGSYHVTWDTASGRPKRLGVGPTVRNAESMDGRFLASFSGKSGAEFLALEDRTNNTTRTFGIPGIPLTGAVRFSPTSAKLFYIVRGVLHTRDAITKRTTQTPLEDPRFDQLSVIGGDDRYVLLYASQHADPSRPRTRLLDTKSGMPPAWLSPSERVIDLAPSSNVLALHDAGVLRIVDGTDGTPIRTLSGVAVVAGLGPGARTVMTLTTIGDSEQPSPDFELHDIETGRILGRWATSP